MNARSGLVALILMLVAVPAAAADDADAQASALFRSGAAAYDAGDYKRAAAAFEAAFAIAPRGPTAYNAAIAWESSGDIARAADAYDRALTQRGLTHLQSADALERMQKLMMKLGTLEVRGPEDATASIEYVTGARLPLVARLLPGVHELRVHHADGSVARRSITIAAGGRVAIEEAQGNAPSPPPVAVAPPPIAEPAATSDRAPPPPPSRSSSPQRTLGWIGVGTGAALGAVTAILGVNALGALSDFKDGGDTDPALHDRAASLRAWTNVTLTAALVVGVAGIVLLLTAPKTAHPTTDARLLF